MKNNPVLIALASALITAAAIKAAPALAQESKPAETAVSFVRTADLDLGSNSGLKQLDQRLSNAAREVCGTASDADIRGKNEVRRCPDETLARAHIQRDRLIAIAERGAVIAVAAAR